MNSKQVSMEQPCNDKVINALNQCNNIIPNAIVQDACVTVDTGSAENPRSSLVVCFATQPPKYSRTFCRQLTGVTTVAASGKLQEERHLWGASFTRIRPAIAQLAADAWRATGSKSVGVPKNGWRCYQPIKLLRAIDGQVKVLGSLVERLKEELKNDNSYKSQLRVDEIVHLQDAIQLLQDEAVGEDDDDRRTKIIANFAVGNHQPNTAKMQSLIASINQETENATLHRTNKLCVALTTAENRLCELSAMQNVYTVGVELWRNNVELLVEVHKLVADDPVTTQDPNNSQSHDDDANAH